jgi:hypothetical protein
MRFHSITQISLVDGSFHCVHSSSKRSLSPTTVFVRIFPFHIPGYDCLGHLNHADILRMTRKTWQIGLPTIEGYPNKFECPHCWAAKAAREPYLKKACIDLENANVCDELHSDTFGPILPMSRYKHSYVIIFTIVIC